jgi:hypothetical protein
LALGKGWKERLFLWPALSAGANLLQRMKLDNHDMQTVAFFEDKEEQDVVLWQQEEAIPNEDTKPRDSCRLNKDVSF